MTREADRPGKVRGLSSRECLYSSQPRSGACQVRHAALIATVVLPNLAVAQSAVGPTAKRAWSENCGWINFRDAGSLSGTQGARLLPTHLRGYAWGKNIGWINFDTTSTAVSFCRADFDGSGVRDVADIFAFLSAWFAADARADYDYSGGVNVADIFVFLSIWFAGC